MQGNMVPEWMEVRELFRLNDVDKNNFLSWEEFVRMALVNNPAETYMKLVESFS